MTGESKADRHRARWPAAFVTTVIAATLVYVVAYLAVAQPAEWPVSGGRITRRTVDYPHPALEPLFAPAERLDPRLRQ